MSTRALTLLVVLVALPSFAQSNEVKKYLNIAITLYENLEYEKALKQLKSARTKAKGPDDEAKINLLEGIVLADMGKEEKAISLFKAGFSVDLEAKLPVEVSPKVQAVAEKARTAVRKVLAPQLEAEKAEEEKRLAEEKKKAEEEAARVAEAKRIADEEAKKNQPPPAPIVVKEEPKGPSVRALSWIPGVVGLASAGVATAMLVSASGKYNALKNGTAPPEQAIAYRETGKTDATLGYVFTGVAVAGVGAAVVMFLAGGEKAPAVSVAPLNGGGYVSVGFDFDLGGAR
ncbi:MAG: tetratricopeptide repeat protein [Myxococcaceae bacterium]